MLRSNDISIHSGLFIVEIHNCYKKKPLSPLYFSFFIANEKGSSLAHLLELAVFFVADLVVVVWTRSEVLKSGPLILEVINRNHLLI